MHFNNAPNSATHSICIRRARVAKFAPGCRKSFKYQPQITTIKTNVLKNLLNAAHTHTHTHTENIHTRTHAHTLSACRPIKRFQNKPNKCQRAQKVADSTTICAATLLLSATTKPSNKRTRGSQTN